ncbi:response regulator [Clostridium lacusfryxellense]|uniref:response regulator n=1 Tax=Clostridium lacusfryxellense TaxID=205328 RepID=UPI001C0B500D|nr:response regulator [Clostridium lacusfryxellense]MBU3114204.1 response regulator [Clostridium lacusfryxellense]
MIKVLIVEDDPMVREINEKFLKKVDGFILHNSVNSIEKAKDVILEGNLDLVLLDVFFPLGKGTDLLKWIRQENLKCDVILITADRNTETVEEAFRYGAVDYLVKPFIFNRFKEALLQFKSRKNSFENVDNIEQSIIDKYTIKDNNHVLEYDENIGEIKGFNQYTYEKVLGGIASLGDDSFTSEEIAINIGVSRITARRYLDYLEKENKLIVEMEYGKVGRPKNKYKIK